MGMRNLTVNKLLGPVFSAMLWLSIAVLLVSLYMPVGVAAITPLSRGYNTSARLPLGSVVSLENNSTDTILPATVGNVDNLLGVVISDETSLLSVKSGEGEQQVQVATSGTIDVLVSDINGPIERGDHVTASPISGVGMKATGNVRVVGIAQGNLEGGVQEKYTDESGTEQTVNLGQVPVLVNVAYYFKEPERTVIPSALQNLANAIAGKNVNTIPILISLGVFVVMLVVVASIIYSMIRGSIISVGRNPMSQSAVYRNLVQMSALVIIILGIGFSAMYLIITRVG